MILFGSLLAVSSPKNTKTAWTKKTDTYSVGVFIYIYMYLTYIIYLALRQVDISTYILDSIVVFLTEGDRWFLKRGSEEKPKPQSRLES